MASRPSQEKLVHCANCGEDYSPTYRKCPFCGARNDPRAAQTPRSSRPAASDPDGEPTRVIPRAEDDEREESPRPAARRDRRQEEDDGYEFDGQDLFDDEDDYEEDYRPARGGKRLAGGNGGGRSGRASSAPVEINWPRVITFLCSLIIIIAAMVILFTGIYPQLHKDPTAQTSEPVNTEQIQPSDQTQPSEQVQPSEETQPSEEVQPSESGSGGESTEPSGGTGEQPAELRDISVEAGTVELLAGHTYQFVPTFEPADWSGEVTFTSDNEKYATVDENGIVTNLNTEAGTTQAVTITIASGGLTLDCTVRCAGPAAESTTPPTAAPTTPPVGGEIAPGTKGVVTGASGGLRVRSGPGTTYSQVTSLKNGDAVTVVSYAGDGWYEITYDGSGGQPSPGYIMGEFIAVS